MVIKISEIVTTKQRYQEVLDRHKIHLGNVYMDYNYTDNKTTINLVILARETTDFMALFEDLRALYPTDSIRLATQVG